MPTRPDQRRPKLSRPPSLLASAPSASPPPIARGSARSRGYDARWDRETKSFLAVHPLCRGCEAVGLVRAATLTDHVIPHRGDMVRFWDRAWWQASCDWHHNVIKQLLEARFDAGEIGCDDLWLDSAVAVDLARREGVC